MPEAIRGWNTAGMCRGPRWLRRPADRRHRTPPGDSPPGGRPVGCGYIDHEPAL